MRENRLARLASSFGVLGAIGLGVAMLSTGSAEARRPPGPLCGPTILYECTFRDGSTQLVGLTVCEVGKYEKRHQATCVPGTF